PPHAEAYRHVGGKEFDRRRRYVCDESARLHFGSPRPPLPAITHRAKGIEEGRVCEIAPETAFGIEPLYFVRVRTEGPQKTIIELFIPPIKYEAPLRDALAKCA